MFGKNSLKTLLAAGAMIVAAGAVNAATIQTYCPGTAATTDREFTLTIEGPTAAGCVVSGPGNTDTPEGEALIFPAIAPAILLDKTDGPSNVAGVVISAVGVGALSGTWSIALAPGVTLTNVYLALKSGNGPLDPDWAVFSLPTGTLSGSWSIASGQQSLSHMSLYGTVAAVPVPAAGFLMIGALGGLAALRRRRRAV